jgi:predicted P-loop ATPase
MADDHTPRERPVSLLGKAAINYARKGYRVFPLEPRGKTPRTEHGVKDATTDIEQVTRWWRAMPDANIGIATGSGLLVLDIDGPQGQASLDELEGLYGPLPRTPTQRTGKGRHFLFAVTGPVKNSASRIGPGIDTRGDGGYIVGGPSIHPNGEPYTWDADARPSQLPAAECPAWILDRLAPKISERAAVSPAPVSSDPDTLSRYAAKALDGEFERVSASGNGTRNHALNAAAFSLGQLVGAGMLAEGLVVQTLQTAASNCGLTSDDGPQQVLATINSGLGKGKQNPRVVEMRRPASPMRTGKPAAQPGTAKTAKPAAAPGPTAGPAAHGATVHALDDARPAATATATAWRESVWLTAEPEDWVLTKDGSKLGSSTHNTVLHLKHERALAGLFALDERSRHIVMTRDAPWGGPATPHRLITDADITGLVCWLETHALRPKFNDAKRAIQYAAHENMVNPVRDRLAALTWDETPRLDHWLVDFLGAGDTSFVRQAGAKWLISAVARILRPGCKVDTMLVLEGPQGARKSSTLAALAAVLGENTFSDRLSKLDGKDAVIELQGQVIVEIAELDAFRNSAVSLIKAFLSRQVDKIRLPWDATVTELQRSCVFAGTVNPGGAGWMHDVTGGRRFWPVEVGQIDLAGLSEAAPQLWAEAAARYAQGEEWWLTDELVIAEANRAAMDRTDEDVWAPDIDRVLIGRDEVRVEDVLLALNITDLTKRTEREQRRIYTHLHRRNFVRKVVWRNGASVRSWVRKSDPAQ